MEHRHARWFRILACGALALSTPGCSLISLKSPERPLSARDLNARILTRELSAQYVAGVSSLASDIAASESDTAVLDNALRWEIGAVGASRRAATRMAPMMSLLDSWALAQQLEAFSAEGAPGGALFGAHSRAVHELDAAYATDAEALARRLATPQEFARYQGFVAEYARAHPLTDLTFTRASVVALWSREQKADTPLIDSLGTIPEALNDASDRLEIYGDTVPTQMMRKTELALSESGFGHGDLRSALHQLDERLERLTAAAESAPELVRSAQADVRASLREVLAQLDSSSRAAQGTLHSERVALFADLQGERAAVVAAADAQRRALTEDAGRISTRVVHEAGVQLRDLAAEVLLLGIVVTVILLGLPFAAGYFLGRARHGDLRGS
ncbi:MAG TPA: hypothetical protein VNX02_00345 [Steroidobacteraceae bacterium]|jgi:hypothetical protein|nr:hypothetical protein [Steroidobacteraceae bacterium]